MKKISIGSLEINSFVYIPPMAGITDLTFRKIVRMFNKNCLMSTEMVSSKALLFTKEHVRMKLSEDEHPVGIQLFGHEADVMAKAGEIAEEQGADFIDINMGCPAPKITNGKDGAALMREPDLAVRIACAVVNAVKVPVTVKMRLGWDECKKNAPALALRLQEIGICAFTIHGRTREQGYSGKADWAGIAKVKEVVSVPVFGNGDIRTPYDAKELIDVTGCDGVAVARAVTGSPWLPKQIDQYLTKGSFDQVPTEIKKIDLAVLHLEELIRTKGVLIGMKDARRHLINYVKGMPGSSQLRTELSFIKTREEALTLLNRLKEKLQNNKVNTSYSDSETREFDLISIK